MKHPKLFHLFLILNIAFFFSWPPKHTLGNPLALEALLESKDAIIATGALIAAAGKALLSKYREQGTQTTNEIVKEQHAKPQEQTPSAKRTSSNLKAQQKVAQTKPYQAIPSSSTIGTNIYPEHISTIDTEINRRVGDATTFEELRDVAASHFNTVKLGSAAGEIIHVNQNHTIYPIFKSENSSGYLGVQVMNNKPSLSLPRVTKVTPDNLCDFTKSAKRKLKSMSASEFEAFLAFKPGTEKFIRSVGGKNAFLIQQYQFWQFPGFMDYIRTMPDYKPFIYMVEKEVNNRVHSKFEQMTKYVPGFGGCSHYHKWALGILGSPKDKYGFHEFIKKESKVLHDNDVQIEKEYLRKIEEAARIQQAAKSKMLQRRAVWLEEQAAQDAKLSLDENFENYAGDLDDVYFDEIKVETYELTNQAINHLEKFGFDTEGFSSCEGNVYQRFLQKELVETVNQTSEVLEAFADDYHINNISTLIYDFANEAISFISEDKIEIGLELCEFCSDLLELGKAVALELQEEETDIRIQNKLNPILDIVFHQVNQTENLDVLIDNASLSFCKIALLCHEDEANVNQLAQFPSLNSNLEFNPVEKILNQTKEILDVVNEEGSFWAARTLEQINTDPNLIKIHGSIKNAFEAIIIENKKQFEEEMAENDYPYDPDDDPWIVYSFEDSGESECKTRIQVTGEPSIDPDPEDPKDKDKKKRKLRDSESSKYKHSIKGQLKKHKLPTKGKIRFVPSKSNLDIGKITYKIINGAKNFTDKFGNIWQAGRSITAGENIEWDVQLFRQGIQQLGWASRSGKHINVSLKGIITH